MYTILLQMPAGDGAIEEEGGSETEEEKRGGSTVDETSATSTWLG